MTNAILAVDTNNPVINDFLCRTCALKRLSLDPLSGDKALQQTCEAMGWSWLVTVATNAWCTKCRRQYRFAYMAGEVPVYEWLYPGGIDAMAEALKTGGQGP